MPAPQAVDGTSLVLTFGAVDHACSISSYELRSDESDSDVTTFCEASEGGQFDHILAISALTSTASGSFWRYLWANPGVKEVPYVLKPHGNAAPTADKPHLTGTLTVPGGIPTLSSEASRNPTRSTFDVEFKLDARPTLVTS
jgi:hypothetical protein